MDDRWIDEVAREMTAAAAPEDLKPRVLARIANGEGPRQWSPSVRFAAAAAALVAAVALTVSLWPGRQDDNEPRRRSEPGPSATAALAPAPIQRGPDPFLASRPGVSEVRPAPQAASPAPVVVSERSTAMALVPEPLTIEAIAFDVIAAAEPSAIDPLEVATLTLTRLEIEPIASMGDLQ